jgi:uncharacterized CHY-type Zn-finger protein
MMLDFKKLGLSNPSIAIVLNVKLKRVAEGLYKARHPEKMKIKSRKHGKKYYYKNIDEQRNIKRVYWEKDKKKWEREKLVTRVNGKTITVYHLNKRQKTKGCELCDRELIRLYYHHWDNGNFSKGMWVCGSCHRFITRIESGFATNYLKLKKYIEESFTRSTGYGQSGVIN